LIPQTNNNRAIITQLLSINDSYKEDTKAFVKFLDDNGLVINFESVQNYITYLRAENDGKRLSASTYNKRIMGLKKRLRYLFKNSPEFFDVLKRYEFEEFLDSIKQKRINSHGVESDKLLTPGEIEKLIYEAESKTISLMIEFLAHTGVRISEMLNILLSDIVKSNGKSNIRILGKGGKERIVYADTALINGIKQYFRGNTYLFEHHGKPYSSNSTTQRITTQGMIVLGKHISAHTLRHSFATNMLKKTGNLKGVSKYLGHASTSTTADLYVHDELQWEDIHS